MTVVAGVKLNVIQSCKGLDDNPRSSQEEEEVEEEEEEDVCTLSASFQ